MNVRGEIYRGIAITVLLSTIATVAMASVLPEVQAQEEVSVSVRHTKNITLFSVRNSGDQPIYGFQIEFSDSDIRWVKVRGWDRERLDSNAVMVRTNDRPIQRGATLITMVIVGNKDSPYGWSALDANGNAVASTLMETPTVQQPEPEREKGEFKPSQLSSRVTITGAGATFPFPLIDKWRVEFNKVHPMVDLNYQSIGSGGGIRQFIAKTVDFGASDAPLTTEQYRTLNNPLQIPESIGAVAVAYNLLGIGAGMKLTPDVVADIFLGKIRKWNDASIAMLNPELQLPDRDILVVHRSDGSGTTFVFTDYLDRVSDEWHERVGKGTAVQWPTGVGAVGNEGVAATIRGQPYTIGYVELAYVLQTGMSYAALQNQEGEFIMPSLESTKAAAANLAPRLPKPWEDWSQVSIVNARGTGAYPISSLTYLLVYQELSNVPGMTRDKAQALVDFLWWAVHDGQQFAPALEYVPLPDGIVEINTEAIERITFQGRPLNIPT